MNHREPLPITVVIPAYNAAKTIERALASVLAQTAPAQEVIVVDDGSTDATAHLAQARGVRVITQTNAGTGGARNAGIRAATGAWIALLDADDEWMPTKLEAQWDALAHRPEVGIVASDHKWVHRDGTVVPATLAISKAFASTARSRLAENVLFMRKEDVASTLVTTNFLLPSTLLVSKEVFESGGYFRARGELVSTPLCEEAEDLEWALRALRTSDVIVVERSLVNYHLQVGSISAVTGRMRYGDVKLGERIVADPSKYAPGIGPMFLATRPTRLRTAAREFVRAGDISRARVVLSEATRESRVPGDRVAQLALALSDNALGRWGLEATRSLWKSTIKPLVVRRSSDA